VPARAMATSSRAVATRAQSGHHARNPDHDHHRRRSDRLRLIGPARGMNGTSTAVPHHSQRVWRPGDSPLRRTSDPHSGQANSPSIPSSPVPRNLVRTVARDRALSWTGPMETDPTPMITAGRTSVLGPTGVRTNGFG
jgi:hypothetical protein